MKQVMYTITGLPYVGKTTLSNELIKRFGFSVVSIDEINTKRGVGINPEIPITQPDWDIAYSEAFNKLKEYLSHGKNVIFDGGSLLFREREMQRQIAKEFGAEHKLVYVIAPKELIEKRRAENLQTKTRGHVRDDNFEAALNMFEEPREDENPIIFTQGTDIDRWISDHIQI